MKRLRSGWRTINHTHNSFFALIWNVRHELVAICYARHFEIIYLQNERVTVNQIIFFFFFHHFFFHCWHCCSSSINVELFLFHAAFTASLQQKQRVCHILFCFDTSKSYLNLGLWFRSIKTERLQKAKLWKLQFSIYITTKWFTAEIWKFFCAFAHANSK